MSVATAPRPSTTRTPPPVAPVSFRALPLRKETWPFRASTAIQPLSVDQYVRMTELGILTEDDPVELLEGFLVQKMPRNSPHDYSITVITPVLVRLVPVGWVVRCQCAARVGDSYPEPDFAVARGEAVRYRQSQPTADDLALVVEVADTTLDRDRQDKGRIYARAGIPVYWVVNVTDRQVEVYTDPTGDGADPQYRTVQTYGPGMIVPLVLDGHAVGTLAVDGLI
jgi:Uma2 family endonuclease